MTTVNELLTDVFEDMTVLEDEATIEASDAQKAIRALNTMMAKWVKKGLDLGYTRVDSLNDTITVPEGAIDGIEFALVLKLWPKYKSGDPSATILYQAKEGMRAVRKIAIVVRPADYPDTLPFGSGNEWDDYNNDPFYKNKVATLTGFHGVSTVTIAAKNTPVKIDSGWTFEDEYLFRGTADGTFIYGGSGGFVKFSSAVIASLAAGTDACTFYYAVNGVLEKDSAIPRTLVSGESDNFEMPYGTNLRYEDEISVWCENNDLAVDIELTQIQTDIAG